jgi:hypothetical protein
MDYAQAFTELTEVRGYGDATARSLLAAASRGSYIDEFPAPPGRPVPAVQINTLNDAGTEFSVRTVTVRPLIDDHR